MVGLPTKTGDLARGFAKNQRGAITVEFVAILPMLLAALAISYEFGRCLWAQQIVTKDVRDAARYLSRQQAPLTAGVKSQAQNLAQTGQTSGGTMHYPWTAANQVTVTDPYLTFSSSAFRVSGTVVQVEGNIPFTISFLSFLHINTSVTLKAASQVRVIGN